MNFRDFLESALSRTDLDWKRYQRSSIHRRVLRLCGSLGHRSLKAWSEVLDDHEEQRDALLGLLSVPFSRFFRDAAVFGTLANRVLPALRTRLEGRPLRVWSAGCACGQEIYSVAMLFEARDEAQLLATDVNPACLDHARKAVFSEGTLREVPAALRRRFFEGSPAPSSPRWRLRTESLPAVRFELHDLIDDPYPRDQDLILCRNAALTYFRGPALLRVTRRLETSLAPGGCLVVGRGESLPPDVARLFEEEPPGSGCLWRRPDCMG